MALFILNIIKDNAYYPFWLNRYVLSNILLQINQKGFIKLYGLDLIVWVAFKLDFPLIVYTIAIEQITLCFINVADVKFGT